MINDHHYLRQDIKLRNMDDKWQINSVNIKIHEK